MEELERCNRLLAEGYGFLDALGFPSVNREDIPRLVLEESEGDRAVYLAAACQSFYLYRLLHSGAATEKTVLLGDYFFSLFSSLLIPIDSTWLIEAFAQWLEGDAQRGVDGPGGFDETDYRRFVNQSAGRLRLC